MLIPLQHDEVPRTSTSTSTSTSRHVGPYGRDLGADDGEGIRTTTFQTFQRMVDGSLR